MLEMFKNDGRVSLSKVLSTIGYMTFIILSVYLALAGKTWGNYGEFALAAGGSILVRFADKCINKRYSNNENSVG